MLKEWIARTMVFVGVVMAVAVPVVGWRQQSQGVTLHARMAETGGWTPEVLTATVGEPLKLRLTSDDVTHGFAVGKLDQPAVDVLPGEITEISLLFDKPGKYTYYCTRWCSLNHWRMRGTIEVTGGNPTTEPAVKPLYVALGLDLDENHQAGNIPSQIPTAWRGALPSQKLPAAYTRRETYQASTPIDLWAALRAEPTLASLSDQDTWDLVAWIWQSNTTPEQIQAGKALYTANCAACHGENGVGDGVFANELASNSGGAMGEGTQRPADFTDPVKMLSASPAHLQGKIIRGGMGTGMPYWGPIFTDEQTWALVAYLWTFQFK